MSSMAYRFNFVFALIGNTLWIISNILFVNIVFDSGNLSTVAGFHKGDLLLLDANFMLLNNLANFLFSGLWDVGDHILSGYLDTYLLKPLNTRLKTQFVSFNFWGIWSLFPSVAFVFYCFSKYDYNIQFLNLIGYLILFLIGLIIYYCFFLALVSVAFWVKEVGDFLEIINILGQLSDYPRKLFGKPLQFLFTFIIPAFPITYFGVSFLLGKENYLIIFVALFILAIFWSVSSFIWNRGLKRYNSASS